MDSETGEGLPGANVVAKKEGLETGAASTGSGEFSVPNLPSGSYMVTVSYIGYETQRINIDIASGQTATLDVKLVATGIEFNAISISASRRPEKTLEAPASVTVMEAREIQTEVAPSTIAALRNVPGVDMAQTGVDRREVVLRGFNNAFSRSAYILTDYRQAGVASLGVNIHSIMPNMSVDVEKVEIVRGPGSALYGAGVDNGVIHYISKSPFEHPGTTVSIAGGERSSVAGQFRHAGLISSQWGYKLTGQYAQADDWELDPNDPEDKVQLDGDVPGVQRDYDYRKMNFNGMLQYRASESTSLSFNGGFSQLDGTVLSGIGPLQADGFGYTYAQARLQSGNFFAQGYINKNNVGDSYVYNADIDLEDSSTLINLQTQYDLALNEKHQAIFGIDYERTEPITAGTINGRYEDDDLISEVGAYVQTSSMLSPQFDVTLALRVDKNNLFDDLQLSPRVAVVFKADAANSFRATYNRAFSSPGVTDNFLDIVAREAVPPAVPFDVRAMGSIDGFTFARNAAFGAIANTDLVAYSLNPAAPGAPTPAGLPLDVIYASVYQGLAAQDPAAIKALLPAPLNGLDDATIAQLVGLLSPSLTQVQGFTPGGLFLLKDPSDPTSLAPISNVTDIEPLKQNITQTLELGYKGLLGQNTFFTVDLYYTKKKNFVGPLLVETPFVVMSRDQLAADLEDALASGLANNAQLAGALAGLGLPPEQVPVVLNTVSETVVNIARPGLPNGPVAIVAPQENAPAAGQYPDLLLAYRSFGQVEFWGFDVAVQRLWNDRLSTFANMSILNDNFFDNEELDESGTDLSLAINSPKLKVKGGFNYNIPKGVSFGASYRFVQGFPVASGPYVGDVEDYSLLDVNLGYDLSRWQAGMRFDVTIQNILNNDHREFVGAPKLGRFAMARITYSIQ
jgi:iron complex outermembrane receptor protein